jgi:Leucine-rich repeat (LRR) protein
VILSILSQTSAFGGPCDWGKYSRNQSKIVIEERCGSTNIDSTFLGRDSEDFSNLTHFVMHYTKLTKIKEEQFVKAVNLETLDLSRNKIELVAERAFIKLHKLTILNLQSNQIKSLPMGAFADLPFLSELNLGYNRLTWFDFSIVKQNLQLKKLEINQNPITNVTTSQQYSSNLTYIDMSMNSLTSLPMENLPVCLNLQTLNLDFNKIQHVNDNAFIGFHSLTTLGLNAFADLSNLSELNLANNHLTSFDFAIVKQNPQLKKLEINANFMKNLTTSQQYSSNLTYIDLGWNSLTSLPMENLPVFLNLQTLELEKNQIQHVNDNAFIGFHNLTTLDLRQNKIQILPMGAFADLPNLSELNLANNHLTSFDFAIVKQNPQLKKLEINANYITNVTTSQQYSSNLTYIDLGRNCLTSLPMKKLPDFPNLQRLSIYTNNLAEFDFESVKDKFPKLELFVFLDNRFDCCFLEDSVNTMLSDMPNLEMVKNLNNSIKFQELTKCTTCDRKIFEQRKIDELKMIEEKKQKQQQNHIFFMIGLAFAIGIPFIIELIICLSHFQKATY